MSGFELNLALAERLAEAEEKIEAYRRSLESARNEEDLVRSERNSLVTLVARLEQRVGNVPIIEAWRKGELR